MSRVGKCTDRDCGNNPNRKVNYESYDSVMGFLCNPCQDEYDEDRRLGPAAWCDICGEHRSRHEEPFPCKSEG